MVPSNTSAVNAKVSPSVGCGWTVSDISSASEPISIASIPSEIISPAEGPTIPTPKTVLDSVEIIPVKNVDEVLKVALTKPLKRVEWVELDQLSKKEKIKEELSTH